MDNLDRVYVGWEGGYFVTSLDPDFHKAVQDMAKELGPPSVVEFRATNEGWVESSSEDEDD